MKQLLLGLILAVTAASASAQHHGWRHGHHGGYHGNKWNWVLPAVIGGTVIYAATRPPVFVQQPPIIVQQPPTEIVYIDGNTYRRQVMIVNGQYQEVLVRF